MNQETKICQNCKQEFVIEPEDFQFYEKLQVPPPTFCPNCRFQRRLMFRNERSLYKRTCDLCGNSMVSVFSPDKPYAVYCGPCWWSDKWDAAEYAQPYDPSRNFFEQLHELQMKIPYQNLVVSYTQLVNSDYTNHAGHLKNCYLIFNADYCENVCYAENLQNDKDSMDCSVLDESELSYGDINCQKCSRCFFSEDLTNCFDVLFSKNLIGCSFCFGCMNLRNKKYHIFNQPVTKDDYQKKMEEFRLDSYSSVEEFKKKAGEFWKKFPHKYIHGLHNVNVSGDYVYESKNALFSYQSRFVEDGKFVQLITAKPCKDVYDYTEWGNGAQRIYECITVGEGANTVKFSFACWLPNSMNIEYSMFTVSSANMFGCVGMRKKQYCVLNKEYGKGEYEAIRKNIVRDMNERPYIDAKGRVFKYGEFFPYDLSLFDYNESAAAQYFYPLSKEKVTESGWRWREPTPSEYKITVSANNLPDSIHEVEGGIVNEIIACNLCGRAYRIVKSELDLLRLFNFPLPRRCHECRFRERLGRMNPPRWWSRNCAKCKKDILTSYAPERLEIIYCEHCYNSEIV